MEGEGMNLNFKELYDLKIPAKIGAEAWVLYIFLAHTSHSNGRVEITIEKIKNATGFNDFSVGRNLSFLEDIYLLRRPDQQLGVLYGELLTIDQARYFDPWFLK
jgi:hypothetical protein